MKRNAFFLILLIVFMGVQCNREDDEDLYYEPLVDGIYNVEVDQDQSINFTIEPNKAVSVNGEFNNGIKFTVEFEADALKYFEKVEASISPVIRIQDLPSDILFHFGFVFAPEGVEFNKPGKMTIELPAGTDISDFKGFFFEGGVPYGSSEAEIWSVKLTPLFYQSANGKTQAVFELPHFSGFAGVSGGDFQCGNPLATEVCEDLKEILACYITGKESLTSKDLDKVNTALRIWLEAALQWIEDNPSEMDEDWEVENILREVLCWHASALMFNSTLDPFDDLLRRVGNIFTRKLVDQLEQLNNDCLAMSSPTAQANSFGLNSIYLSTLESLRSAGMLTEEPGIDQINYCNSVATRYYVSPFMDTAQNHIRYLPPFTYRLNFGGEADPGIPRSLSFTVYAMNLLGEPIELELGKDYTTQLNHSDNFTLNGNTVTEANMTCENTVNGVTTYYPCYPNTASISFYINLNTSGEFLYVHAGRYLW
ncbi:MAG: hypothetical protein E4H10_07270 [Bacteroidia bacterium]|nr:MAG: hypothetical protein E4H10_07270 [Bacteroidia bacterium]